MNLVSFGCSLTFGTDLPDSRSATKTPTPSMMTWPALLSQSLNMHYVTRAHGGIGNLAIADRVAKNIHFHTETDRFFIINWTFIDRFDFSHPNGIHFNSGQHDYKTVRPGEVDELSQFYFRHFHSEYKDKYLNLLYLKTTLDILQKNKIKFLMTAIDDILWDSRYHCPPHIAEMQNSLRPYIVDFQGKNFLNWSRHHGFGISNNNHPLAEAHEAAAKYMLPICQALLTS